jgi:hypothetical protein
MRTFFDKEVTPEKKVSSYPQPALNPAAVSATNVEPTTNRIKEAEIAKPFSVTEDTTATLKNKQPFNQS